MKILPVVFAAYLSLVVSCANQIEAADVAWTATVSGSWIEPSNWSSNPDLPQSSDAVSIPEVLGSITVAHDEGDTTIDSLLLEARLDVNGGNFEVLGDVDLLPGSWVRAKTQFVAHGNATIDSASLYAGRTNVSSGQILFPGLSTYGTSTNSILEAVEQDSLLDLSAVHTINGPDTAFRFLSVHAYRGGTIDLSQLTNVTRRNLDSGVAIVAEDAGSLIDLSRLSSLTNTGIDSVTVRQGAELRWANPTVTDGVSVRVGGTLDTSSLTAVTNGWIGAENGTWPAPDFSNVSNADFSSLSAGRNTWTTGTLNLPRLTTYNAAGNSAFEATEPGSLLNLSSLRNINGPNSPFRSLSVYASRGATIDLSSLDSVVQRHEDSGVTLLAENEGTIIDLASLSDLSDTGITSITVRPGAAINWGNPTSADQVAIRVGGSLNTAPLTSITNGLIGAENGSSPAPDFSNVSNADSSSLAAGRPGWESGVLSLPKLTEYRLSSTTSFQSQLPGSLLDLSALHTINGPDHAFRSLEIFASQSGKIDLSALSTVNQRHDDAFVTFTAEDNAEINLSGLGDLTGSGVTSVTVRRGAEIKWGNPVVADRVTIQVGGTINTQSLTTVTNGAIGAENGDGPTPDFSNVSNADSSSLSAGRNAAIAGTLALPSLRNYATSARVSFATHEPGSLLDLSALQTINGPDLAFRSLDISAIANSKIDLSGLTTANRRHDDGIVPLLADGESAEIIVTLLPDSGAITSMTAINSGAIRLGNINASYVEITSQDNGVIAANRVTLLERAVLTGHGIDGSVTNRAGSIDVDQDTMRIDGQYFHDGGSLNIPAGKSLQVAADYDNSDFGIGNAFDHRANISGTGEILADSAEQAVSGDAITLGSSGTPRFDFGNVHVGRAHHDGYNVENTGETTGLRIAIKNQFPGSSTGANQLSGSGGTPGNFGPIAAGDSLHLPITLTAQTAGPQPTQSLMIDNNFDNVATQIVSFDGVGFRLAEPSVVADLIDVGIVHVGDSLTPATIVVGNDVVADGYSESLNVQTSVNNDLVANDSTINRLLPASTDSQSISTLIDTSAAGIKNGVITLEFESDGTGSSELGVTPIGSQTIEVVGQVNNYARPTLAVDDSSVSVATDAAGNVMVDFGVVAVDSSVESITLRLLNEIAAPADYLAGSWTITGSGFELGTLQPFEQLDAGSELTYEISIDTSELGSWDSTATLVSFSENESGFSQAIDLLSISFEGLVQTSLPGDFDRSGDLDVADLGLLADSLQSGQFDPLFDLDQNGSTNFDDISHWVVTLKGTWIGDSNLDGEFNSSDLVLIFQAGRFETEGSATWQQGDWNGDGLFDSGDLVVAFQQGGYENGLRAATPVPEPRGVLLAMTLLVFSCCAGRAR